MSQTEIDLVEERLNAGLLGYWYVVAKSVDIKAGTPVPLKALGRDLVLWRGEDGKVRCLQDFCPHRGAPLSCGQTIGNHIACSYHGVTLDGDGTVVSVPGMADCALQGRRPIDAYAVQEASDAVFVYFPSAVAPTPPPLALPREITSDGFTNFLCTSLWKTNYRYVLDNLVDPMHGIFLHGKTFTLSRGARQDTVAIERTPTGFIVKRVGQQEVNFDWSEIVFDSPVLHARAVIPYPPAAGPGGPMFVIAFVTPIDANTCRIFFWRTRKVSSEIERQSWRFLFRASLEPRHWHVLEQDREMLEHMPRSGRPREMLYQHDMGVTRLRQMMRRKVEAELRAESDGPGGELKAGTTAPDRRPAPVRGV